MNRSEANEKAKQHISNAGFGTGTNITTHALKCMMVDFYLDNQVENLGIADVTERFSPDSDEIEQMAMDIDDFIDDVKHTGRVGTYSKRLRTYLAQKLNEYAR